MKSLHYLAYGSNLLPARLRERIEVIAILGRVAIPGWRLCFHKKGADGSGKCNLVVDATSTAYGAVYKISEKDKHTLDKIEGVGKGYVNSSLTLPPVGQASVYLATSSHIDDTLVPYDWYLRFVVEGARCHRFPQLYVDRLASVTQIEDQNHERRRRNLAIIET